MNTNLLVKSTTKQFQMCTFPMTDIFQVKTDCVYSNVQFSVRVLSSASHFYLVADFVTDEGQTTILGLQKQTEAKLTGMVPR